MSDFWKISQLYLCAISLLARLFQYADAIQHDCAVLNGFVQLENQNLFQHKPDF